MRKATTSTSGVKWIRTPSGNTYLCPASAIGGSNGDEELLQAVCLDESSNPQNN